MRGAAGVGRIGGRRSWRGGWCRRRVRRLLSLRGRIRGAARMGDPCAGRPGGALWARTRGRESRGQGREGGRGRRCAPGPAGTGKGRPGEDLGGGQGVSRAGGEEPQPGAGPGPPPPVPLPAPLWQLPPVPSPSAPLPQQRRVPPRMPARAPCPPAAPSPPARSSPVVLALPACPEMSVTPAVLSRPRRPREFRGDGGSEAREGRRRCQQ